MEPITREEKFMAAAAGEDIALPSPITRKELFLAKAAGMDVNTPTPITREEMFLSRITAGGTPGGGGTGSATPSAKSNGVNFIDYDGTALYSYSVEEAQALTELPALPAHDGLICQGWNWSLESIKALNRPVTVGAMYITDDGKTRIYITLQEGRTSPMLGCCPNGTVTVDWGDGTEPDTLTGTSTSSVKWTPNHEYAAPGDYVITLTVDGTMGFFGSNISNQYSGILRYASGADNRNQTYQNSVQKIEVGNGVTYIGSDIGGYVFQNCYSLASITIPDSITSIGAYAFQNCYSLASITIPDGVTVINSSAFQNCYSLASITIPDSVTSIGAYAFQNCYGVSCYDFTACASVPTLSNTTAFAGIAADCQMLIPATLYDEWSTATNWATYASYMVAV